MRLTKARIEPLGDEVMSPERAAYLRERAASPLILGIHRTLAHDPKTMDAFLDWGGHILSRDNGLPPRQREMVILRTGFLCKSGYEWAQHIRMGAREGLTEAEIAAIKVGADDPIWSDADRALLRAADELHADQFISDAVWGQLKAHFDTRAIFIAIMAVGQYTTVSMFLNSVGVQLDEGQVLDPDLKG
ncbi:MAG: carboxymuconolactone decarboxylase family protein [Alphaproteobacteria bacterium]